MNKPSTKSTWTLPDSIRPFNLGWTLAKMGREIKDKDPIKAAIMFQAANVVAEERRAG